MIRLAIRINGAEGALLRVIGTLVRRGHEVVELDGRALDGRGAEVRIAIRPRRPEPESHRLVACQLRRLVDVDEVIVLEPRGEPSP